MPREVIGGPAKFRRGRFLPPAFKHEMSFDATRKFTWRERILILLGQEAEIQIRVITEHRPGQFAPEVRLFVDRDDIKPLPTKNKETL